MPEPATTSSEAAGTTGPKPLIRLDDQQWEKLMAAIGPRLREIHADEPGEASLGALASLTAPHLLLDVLHDAGVLVLDDTDDRAHLHHQALPECVAPGCTEKGVCQMIAAEMGHLAGRVYAKGDQIRMCYPHAGDVMKAGEGLDQIAEWLRPDAEIIDSWHRVAAAYDGLTPDELRRKRGRLPRMLRECP